MRDYRLRYIEAIFSFVLCVIMSPVRIVYASTQAPERRVSSEAFTKGSRMWSIMAGRSVDDRLGEISLMKFHINRYLSDDFAIYYGVALGYATAKQTRDGAYGGPEFGIRRHFAHIGRWSLYADGSVAAVSHQHPVASGTLRFNFDVQGGGGIICRLNETQLLRGGFRWQHLSNARVGGRARNFGYDGPMFYIGLMQSF